MYLPALLSFRGRQIVNRLAQKIEHSRKSFLAHRNRNSLARINSVDTSHKSVCRAHGYTSYYIVAYMLSHLNNELFALVVYLNGIVKLIDFGIAREVKKEQGKDTVVLGTVGYAAPEQFGFHQSDARTDLYAVGVLCNEMLTGKLPGDGLYNGSQNMQKIILKATAIDAKQRFQTADEMRRALATKKRKQKLSEILLPLPGFRTGKTWKKVTACLGYAFWGIYSIGSIAECNKNTATMLLEALSLGIYLWLPMAVLSNYGSWNHKIYPFSRMPVAAKIILELVLSLVFFVGGYAIENYLRVDVMHIVGK